MNPQLEIEQGIPITRGYDWIDTQIRAMRDALREMKPGDSFAYDGCERYAYRAAKQVGVRVTIRKQRTGGWRVWRID